MKEIMILGTGGTSRDILDTIIDLQDKGEGLKCVGFLDDNKENWGKEIMNVKIIGPLAKAISFPNVYFINGIGSPSNYLFKEKIINGINIPQSRFINLIHPSASVSKSVEIGHDVVILQNVTVATNVKIGNHVVILPNSILSHDSTVGDYSCIAGGVCLSGGAKIGKSCYLGTNSSFLQEVSVGDFSLVGMGSVILTDVPEESVFVGNPAKFLRKVEHEKK